MTVPFCNSSGSACSVVEDDVSLSARAIEMRVRDAVVGNAPQRGRCTAWRDRRDWDCRRVFSVLSEASETENPFASAAACFPAQG